MEGLLPLDEPMAGRFGVDIVPPTLSTMSDGTVWNANPLEYENFAVPAIVGMTVQLWRVGSLKPPEGVPHMYTDIDGTPIAALSVGFAGSSNPHPMLYVASDARTIMGVDLTTKELAMAVSMPDTLVSTRIARLSWMSGSSNVAVGLSDGSLAIMSNSSMVARENLHSLSITQLLPLPNGTMVVASKDGSIAKVVVGPQGPVSNTQKAFAHRGGVTGLVLVDQGSRILSSGEDGCVVVWEADTLTPLYRAFVDSQGVNSLGALPIRNGALITAASRSRLVWVMVYSTAAAAAADPIELKSAIHMVNVPEHVKPVVTIRDRKALDICILFVDRTTRIWAYSLDPGFAEEVALPYWPSELGEYDPAAAAVARNQSLPVPSSVPSPSPGQDRGPKPSVIHDTMEPGETDGGNIGFWAIAFGASGFTLILVMIVITQRNRR